LQRDDASPALSHDLSRQFALNDIDIKIAKLSVSSFRTMLFIITSVAILAVDFAVFPRLHAKTHDFGFSLMDIGVGYFILCHSMRLIRNSSVLNDDAADNSFKKQTFFQSLIQ
jgi:phosphatidylinositol glycan class W